MWSCSGRGKLRSGLRKRLRRDCGEGGLAEEAARGDLWPRQSPNVRFCKRAAFQHTEQQGLARKPCEPKLRATIDLMGYPRNLPICRQITQEQHGSEIEAGL
jgi:hypothetical protein